MNMKIILSPSKTQTAHTKQHYETKEVFYLKEHKKILAQLRKLTKKDIAKIMKLSNELLNQTYQNIKRYSSLESFQAFDAFTGLVFKNIDRDSYTQIEHLYIEEHIRILDAFYGVLTPGTMIKPYRLDMKMNIGLNLYTHWNINNYFKEDLIVNLASDEFSKMIQSDSMISISFLQKSNGSYKNQATYSKMARGMMCDYLIKNKITNIEDIKSFNIDGYSFNPDLSNESTITFTR